MTTTAATRTLQSTAATPVLHLAFELGQTKWKLGFTTGLGQRPRQRTIAARNLVGLAREIERAKARFGLGAAVPVVSCYEAGREGFWLHRWLLAQRSTTEEVVGLCPGRRPLIVQTPRKPRGKSLAGHAPSR